MANTANGVQAFIAHGFLDEVEAIMRTGANQILGTGATPVGGDITACQTAINTALAAKTNPTTDVRVALALSVTTVSLTFSAPAIRTYETD